jgi:glycoside/pentoside/hexuronide:cation symporter, GPH family
MSEERPIAASQSDRVPWPQLIAYGMGGVIPIALFNIAPLLMSLLGNISLGLSAVWLGVIMALPRFWDAVSDPFMGHVSDNTRTRWGRRRPYILLGGVLVAISFMAMWWVPRGEAVQAYFDSKEAYNWFQLSCILVAAVVFFTATTVFEIPHGALGMEMSNDYHERTRLFSAKSFLGNTFAIGNSWLIALASLPLFAGVGGDQIDGMRYLSMIIAAVLIPMSVWWFFTLREPAFAIAVEQKRSGFWVDMRRTVTNSTFLKLTAIIFALSVGFNLVQIFNFYISIFYVYGGDTRAAAPLLGINGTVWAVTGLLAVFPLNWISRRLGKNKTLMIAILLMCAAQLSKIVCYNRELPYLMIIPTVLLSAGMLMFFTLGSSMVGDVCDEAELNTGSRTDGSYYSVYWWFIKMGNALANLGMGLLLVTTGFDAEQNVNSDALRGKIERIVAMPEVWEEEGIRPPARLQELQKEIEAGIREAERLRAYFAEQPAGIRPDEIERRQRLTDIAAAVRDDLDALRASSVGLAESPLALKDEANGILQRTVPLKQQREKTLLRLRLFEIGLPLVLSIVSLALTFRYPLTEERCYEIKAELERRRAAKLAAAT